MPWKSQGGASIAILDSSGFGNCSKPFLLEYHESTIYDMSFSPFNENILATASQDLTIKIKNIPNDGLKESSREFDANLTGHTKKVLHCQWHPCANSTLASASLDGAIKIWDVENKTSAMEYSQSNSAPWCMKWNYDGSLLGCINKGKEMHLFDPRSPDLAIKVQAHRGIKP